MTQSLVLLLSTFILVSGCASIDLQEVDVEDLTITIDTVQSFSSTEVDIYLRRGIWNQPVNANGASLTAVLANGNSLELEPSNKQGRYGFRVSDPVEITRIEIETIGETSVPLIRPLFIEGIETFDGGTYFKDDILSLSLEESFGDQRHLVVTGQCGGAQYTSIQPLSSRAIDLELRLGDIMTRINRAAEADLNGIIPVTLSIEEHYLPRWSAPFEVGTLAAKEESNIQIDTSGFRFKASIGVRISNNFALGFSNQALPTRYCF